MINQARSKNGLRIRLTAERWAHIAEEHGELADLRAEVLETVSGPERILAGSNEELLAVREFEPGKHLVVVYRELTDDGFIITAFVTRRIRSLARREQRWP
ncbi:MAG: hypothetical protein ACYCXT_13755 [Acidiferrobacteraceae bacterium]